jgi:flavin-dependent dehydrogenase
MNEVFDVAVIGAGLGGVTAAIALSQRGAQVALVERAVFPRHKVCGEFLSPEINAVFARVGAAPNIAAAQPKTVTQAHIVAGASTRASLVLPVAGGALALSRYRLDEILLSTARESGTQIFASTRALSIEERDKDCEANRARFVLKLRDDHEEKEISARFVIDASGRGAQFQKEKPAENALRHIGLKAHFRGVHLEEGVVELHPFRGGYCGLVRIEDDLCNACLLSRYSALDGRAPHDFWNHLLQENVALAARMQGATQAFDWLATANVTFGASHPTSGGVLRCGDTAGFIHPLTGDGMAMAARSGELAAAILGASLRGNLTNEQAEELYAGAWHREFDGRLRVGARLQPLLVSPRACGTAIFALKSAPRFAQKLVELTRSR